MPLLRSKRFLLSAMMFTILLALPSASWAGGNALIVHDGTPGIEADALGNLTAKLTAASFVVTPSVGVPGGSLATFKEIWDIRFNNTTPLTASDNAAYQTFLQGGGSLFLMGENNGFIVRDNSILGLIALLGGGILSISPSAPQNTETILAPFTGPNPLSTVTFLAAASTIAPGFGANIANDGGGLSAGLVFGPGTLSNAKPGALIVVWDVNFMQAGADANSQTFLQNLIAYLNAPTVINAGPSSVPLPPTVILVLTGILGILMFLTVRRMKGRVTI